MHSFVERYTCTSSCFDRCLGWVELLEDLKIDWLIIFIASFLNTLHDRLRAFISNFSRISLWVLISQSPVSSCSNNLFEFCLVGRQLLFHLGISRWVSAAFSPPPKHHQQLSPMFFVSSSITSQKPCRPWVPLTSSILSIQQIHSLCKEIQLCFEFTNLSFIALSEDNISFEERSKSQDVQ